MEITREEFKLLVRDFIGNSCEDLIRICDESWFIQYSHTKFREKVRTSLRMIKSVGYSNEVV